MADGYRETKGAISIFLKELKTILVDPKLEFRLEPREDKEYEYTTDYCLETLNYTTSDVIEELLKLELKNYIETCDDLRNRKSKRYYVFGIKRNGKEIYIKVKIESYDNKKVLCMSFHFAEYPLKWMNKF